MSQLKANCKCTLSVLGPMWYVIGKPPRHDAGTTVPPKDFKNEEWINWRADRITALMRDLFVAIKAANPKVIVSISPNPQTFAKNFFLQDWAKWERQGLVEELPINVPKLSRYT